MADKRELKFVRALLGGAKAHQSPSGTFRLVSKSGRASLCAQAVRELASEGVLQLRGQQCFATDVANSWVRRQLSANCDTAGQHRQLKKTNDGISVNQLEGPLAALSLEKGGKPPFLAPRHILAAQKIQALVLRSQMVQRTTMSYDPTRTGGKNTGSIIAAELGNCAIDAKKILHDRLSSLPADCAGVVMDVCGFQKGLQLVETERRWPRRSAKLILRIGLEQLAVQSGLGTVATGRISSKINSWMQENSRPLDL